MMAEISNGMLDLMARRRSVIANKLGEPGPDDEGLHTILTLGARVPDHKGLAPWRFIVFQGEARGRFGAVLEEAYVKAEPEPDAFRAETERNRFLRAPVVIAAVSSPVPSPVVPEWEQRLSLGAACQNIVLAANALGFSCQWVTEWYAYDEAVRRELGLGETEKIGGFIYIGTPHEPPKERGRPDLDKIVTYW